MVALPYNYELHDIVMMVIQHHPSEVYRNRSLDYFETIYVESHEHTRIMAVVMHPYLSGSPHRIRFIRETFEHILSHPGVVCWDGEQILNWFLKERPAPRPRRKKPRARRNSVSSSSFDKPRMRATIRKP